ncbi:MAG: ATP-dependent helicase HrpB [Roseibium sp.]|nr:ATP-dependent helicase HrpB [Roseibium sp.]
MTGRTTATSLPIDGVLPELVQTLETSCNAVLVAEPGAGKTTRVPRALLASSWRHDNKIIVLEPRRLAARAAARRMAFELGEAVGETVGYRVRMDTKVGRRTRIEVVTEGIFTRMIQEDPELAGIAAVLFDEFHERSLDGDLGLALALDAQSALRPDLRLIAMSATLDTASVSALLRGAPVITCEGRSFPVVTRYLGRNPHEPVDQAVARAISVALTAETGSILAFLPGQKEIRRTADRLAGQIPKDTSLAPLYGALDAKEQDRAIRPAPDGQRKVVLASAIAQTSLTIEGVRIVVDSGFARVPRYEPRTGLTRLETVRVSRASADQRRGRAGRTEPGICYRLWDEAQTAALPAADTPEILEADLAPLVLDLALWGTTDPGQLAFSDPPPAAAWAEAVSLLTSLHALDAGGRLTQEGKALARMPIHPRPAHMLTQAVTEGNGQTAALIAVLVSEPGLGGRDVDLRTRLTRLQNDRSPHAKSARQMAERWLEFAGGGGGAVNPQAAGRLLALAYPDRVAEARGQPGRFRLANGRGAELDESDSLAIEPYLTVADVQGQAARGRIALCAPLARADIEELFAAEISETDEVKLDKDGRVKARRVRRYQNVVLESRTIAQPAPDAVVDALISEIRRRGVDRLPWTNKQNRLRARVGFARAGGQPGLPDMSDGGLADRLDTWLGPFLAGCSALSDVKSEILDTALQSLLPFELAARVDQAVPSHFTAPTGSKVPIDYGAEAGPTVSIRVQELFGLTQHPAICQGTLPLTLELLSPAHRPIQITRDLPGFWAGSWSDVKADMKGRYPKHAWPDDPTQASATRHTKRKSGS